MKKATLVSLAIAVTLLLAYLIFINQENTSSLKTRQSVRIIVYFSKSLIDGNTITTKTKNIPTESFKTILEQYGIKELKAVFTNRYDENGFLIYQSKTIEGDSLTGWQTFSMVDSNYAAELVNMLNRENGVYYAHIEQPLELNPCIAPNDPSYGSQWHLNYPYNPMADIRAELAWDINRGRNDVIIAVCDGGVDYTHEDLDPGDRSRVIAGYDFGSGDNDPMDNLPDNDPQSYAGHGTHVAGIIGAITARGTILNSPAAKQMLIHHYLSGSEIPTGAPNYFTNWQNSLNSIGFPMQPRRISISNGSINGTVTASAGSRAVTLEIKTFGGGTKVGYGHINTTLSYNNRGKVFEGNTPITSSRTRRARGLTSSFSIDNSPGGTRPTFQSLPEYCDSDWY